MKANKLILLIVNYLTSVLFCLLQAQDINPGQILQATNRMATGISKVGDEAKAKYAENIDRPYIPTKVKPEYTPELAKELYIKYFKKYVNYYYASKVPAYKNLKTGHTIKNVKNAQVTSEYFRFSSGKGKKDSDWVTIYFKDIVHYQIIYFVKIADNGFYMPYVNIREHLLTCGGKEMADLLFYFQRQFALKYYVQDLEKFKILVAENPKKMNADELTEDQRKYFVQAKYMSENGNYNDAMEYYEKGIAINPLTYPGAYYNLGLVAGLSENYPFAICCMKKYLVLNSDAEDERDVNDKIYQWETLIK